MEHDFLFARSSLAASLLKRFPFHIRVPHGLGALRRVEVSCTRAFAGGITIESATCADDLRAIEASLAQTPRSWAAWLMHARDASVSIPRLMFVTDSEEIILHAAEVAGVCVTIDFYETNV